MAHTEELLMISINDMGRKRLVARLRALRALLQSEYKESPPSADSAPENDMVLMAGLPAVWDDEDRPDR
jgi:hypothetical protein